MPDDLNHHWTILAMAPDGSGVKIIHVETDIADANMVAAKQLATDPSSPPSLVFKGHQAPAWTATNEGWDAMLKLLETKLVDTEVEAGTLDLTTW